MRSPAPRAWPAARHRTAPGRPRRCAAGRPSSRPPRFGSAQGKGAGALVTGQARTALQPSAMLLIADQEQTAFGHPSQPAKASQASPAEPASPLQAHRGQQEVHGQVGGQPCKVEGGQPVLRGDGGQGAGLGVWSPFITSQAGSWPAMTSARTAALTSHTRASTANPRPLTMPLARSLSMCLCSSGNVNSELYSAPAGCSRVDGPGVDRSACHSRSACSRSDGCR